MKKVILILALFFQLQIIVGQSIQLTHIPTWGSQENLKGKVNNTVIEDNQILVYIYVEGWWWVKPYGTNPFTTILSDSTWACNVTTGGNDKYAQRFIAFIVPVGFIIPGVSFQNDLPEDLYNYPYQLACRQPGVRKIDFCGYEWIVKKSEAQIGPDNNYWTDDTNHVFVDDEGELHLSIVNSNNKWYCSEVIADTAFGYGTYSFNIKTGEGLTPYSVLGMFTWDEYANNDFYREIDIELSQWGDSLNENFQYVIQPWSNPANIHRFNIPDYENSTHKFTWKVDTVDFLSLTADSSVVNSWVYSGEDCYEPSSTANPRINLWLFQHHTPQQDIHFTISNFSFEYPLEAPTGINASDGTDSTKVIIQWDDSGEGMYYGVYRSIGNSSSTATLQTPAWLNENYFEDTFALNNTPYYYFVRCSDNPEGSNISGYASGFSEADTGWTIFYNTATDILAYSFPEQTDPAIIDPVSNTVAIQVEYGTDLTGLVATFTLSDGATATVGGVNQQSGITANDFTNPVTYAITAEDGVTAQDWIVTVDTLTGISEFSKPAICIYPNPLSENATIEFYNPSYSSYNLSIYSISGNKVFERLNIRSECIDLERGKLPHGVYIVEIKGEKVFRGKMLVI